jgi:hypothetical protein
MKDYAPEIQKIAFKVASVLLLTHPFSLFATKNEAQFDLICTLRGRAIVDYTADLNQEPGRLAPAAWSDTSRYAIDLKRGRYWNLAGDEAKPKKIVRVAQSQFWFYENANGFSRYNLRTNRYYERAKVGNWTIEIVTGPCRRAPFSGRGASSRPVPRR